MADFRKIPHLSQRGRLGLGAAVLLALGGAGGAGAVSLTRPTIEMAPTIPTAIGKLPTSSGIVTVKGRVAEVYGDRFIVQDGSGRAMVAGGRGARGAVTAGSAVMVQGRYDDGQLHASYLVDPQGRITDVAPPPPPPGRGHGGPGHDGPPPPPPGAGAPPPPPPGAGAPPPPPGAGAPPPPPAGAGAPPPPGAGAPPPPPPPAGGAAYGTPVTPAPVRAN